MRSLQHLSAERTDKYTLLFQPLLTGKEMLTFHITSLITVAMAAHYNKSQYLRRFNAEPISHTVSRAQNRSRNDLGHTAV